VADPKREETFKVVDRRLFTEDGELRKDAVDLERREEESKSRQESASQRSEKPAAAETAEKPSVSPAADATPQASGTPGESETASPAFQMLVDFLTRNAAAMLGGIADPQTGQAFVDIEGAHEVIDMMDALREKTRGNLPQAEEDLLVEVIGSLKLTFMEVSKAATEAMAKKAAKK
jgi:hypothetical protein